MGRYFRTLVDSALLGDTLYIFRKRFLGSTAYAQDPGRSIVVRRPRNVADATLWLDHPDAAAFRKDHAPTPRGEAEVKRDAKLGQQGLEGIRTRSGLHTRSIRRSTDGQSSYTRSRLSSWASVSGFLPPAYHRARLSYGQPWLFRSRSDSGAPSGPYKRFRPFPLASRSD